MPRPVGYGWPPARLPTPFSPAGPTPWSPSRPQFMPWGCCVSAPGGRRSATPWARRCAPCCPCCPSCPPSFALCWTRPGRAAPTSSTSRSTAGTRSTPCAAASSPPTACCNTAGPTASTTPPPLPTATTSPPCWPCCCCPAWCSSSAGAQRPSSGSSWPGPASCCSSWWGPPGKTSASPWPTCPPWPSSPPWAVPAWPAGWPAGGAPWSWPRPGSSPSACCGWPTAAGPSAAASSSASRPTWPSSPGSMSKQTQTPACWPLARRWPCSNTASGRRWNSST